MHVQTSVQSLMKRKHTTNKKVYMESQCFENFGKNTQRWIFAYRVPLALEVLPPQCFGSMALNSIIQQENYFREILPCPFTLEEDSMLSVLDLSETYLNTISILPIRTLLLRYRVYAVEAMLAHLDLEQNHIHYG